MHVVDFEISYLQHDIYDTSVLIEGKQMYREKSLELPVVEEA